MNSNSNDVESQKKESDDCILYEGPMNELLQSSHQGGIERYLYGANKYSTRPSYKKWKARLSNFQVRDNDIWVITFPKSGTTWVQEITWCIVHDLNFAEARKTSIMRRSPFFEFDSLYDDPTLQENMPELDSDDPHNLGFTWKRLHSSTSARIIKSHFQIPQLPHNLLDSKAKIIYVSRDPKDVCVSYYNYWKLIAGFCGTFNDFIDLFLADLMYACPYWKGVLSFWNLHKQSKVFFITYEELIMDNRNTLKKLSKFLGKEFTNDEISSLMEHTSFKSMKNNPSSTLADLKTPYSNASVEFCRIGKVGNWKVHMSDDQIRRFKDWTNENLKGSDFPHYRNF